MSNYQSVSLVVNETIERLSAVDIGKGWPRSDARLFAYATVVGCLQALVSFYLHNKTPEEVEKVLDKIKKV